MMVNSFLKWIEPIINHVKWEILKLVDENTLDKYLEQIFSSDQQSQGVEKD